MFYILNKTGKKQKSEMLSDLNDTAFKIAHIENGWPIETGTLFIVEILNSKPAIPLTST